MAQQKQTSWGLSPEEWACHRPRWGSGPGTATGSLPRPVAPHAPRPAMRTMWELALRSSHLPLTLDPRVWWPTRADSNILYVFLIHFLYSLTVYSRFLKVSDFYQSQLATQSVTGINPMIQLQGTPGAPRLFFLLVPSFTAWIQLSFFILRRVQLHAVGHTSQCKESWNIAPFLFFMHLFHLCQDFSTVTLLTLGMDSSSLWQGMESVLSSSIPGFYQKPATPQLGRP